MSFEKCDIYNECLADYRAAQSNQTGCCGGPQCPNVVVPWKEFPAHGFGIWGPRVEWMFHVLCRKVGEQREQIAALEETIAAIRGDAPRKDIATPEGEMRPTNTGVVAERA